MTQSSLISIVIPVFNEEGNIDAVYRALKQTIDPLFFDFEIIFVDDGSTDRTAELVTELHQRDAAVKLVRFARNFGHQAAITAGMESAVGGAVITMDADLQHPPTMIPQLIEQWKLGYEVVQTQRIDGEKTGILKKATSSLFYRIINACIDRPIVPGGADFRLLDRSVVDQLNQLPERNRFVRGLVSWIGFRQVSIPYTSSTRYSGQTKYTVRRMMRFAADGVTSFSIVPLRMATYLGLLAAVSGVPYAVWAVWARIFTETANPGWASLIVAILFLGGVQLICLGVLGEYIGRIYDEVKCRPLYIARERLGFRPNRVPRDQSEGPTPKARTEQPSDVNGGTLAGPERFVPQNVGD